MRRGRRRRSQNRVCCVQSGSGKSRLSAGYQPWLASPHEVHSIPFHGRVRSGPGHNCVRDFKQRGLWRWRDLNWWFAHRRPKRFWRQRSGWTERYHRTCRQRGRHKRWNFVRWQRRKRCSWKYQRRQRWQPLDGWRWNDRRRRCVWRGYQRWRLDQCRRFKGICRIDKRRRIDECGRIKRRQHCLCHRRLHGQRRQQRRWQRWNCRQGWFIGQHGRRKGLWRIRRRRGRIGQRWIH